MQAHDQKAAADLLDRAYEAILKSDFAALPKLTEQLEQELARGAGSFSEAALRRIRSKADRNAVVLMAAQRGIRSARRRLEEVRNAATGLVTYDRQGKRATIGDAPSLAQRF